MEARFMQCINFNKRFNCIYQLLNLTWRMQDYVVRREYTLLIIEIMTQLEALMVPQPVKPWTTHSACKPTIFFRQQLAFIPQQKIYRLVNLMSEETLIWLFWTARWVNTLLTQILQFCSFWPVTPVCLCKRYLIN